MMDKIHYNIVRGTWSPLVRIYIINKSCNDIILHGVGLASLAHSLRVHAFHL